MNKSMSSSARSRRAIVSLLTGLTLAAAVFLAAPARGEGLCELQMSISCQGAATASVCTAVTRNLGTNTCSGLFIAGYFADDSEEPVQIVDTSTTLAGLNNPENCIDSSSLPPGEESGAFSLCFGEATLGAGQSFSYKATVLTDGGFSEVPLIALAYVEDAAENELGFAYAFSGIEGLTCTPESYVPSLGNSGLPYEFEWGPTTESTVYQVEESTSADFTSNVSQATVNDFVKEFTHNVGSTTTYYYRVRAANCGGGPGPWSTPVFIAVQPSTSASSTSRGADAATPYGSKQSIAVNLFVPPPTGKNALDTTYTASVDKTYMTVSPATGTIPPQGLNLTVTANPATLPAGANTATVTVTTAAGTVASVPVSVSLVTPVSGGGKSTVPPSSLVIPVVTHVNSATGQFLSDVRLTNADTSTVKYEIAMAPTGTNGRTNAKTTTIEVPAGQTIALNDIAKNFFGFGSSGQTNDVGFGALEIRPLNASANLTYASSRTFATTPKGTFGQFIAAVPLSDFATNAPPLVPGLQQSTRKVMSLQQVAQSASFRTNLGIVEGSGQPANGRIRFFDAAGTLLKEVPYSLMPGEHRQINSIFATPEVGLPNVPDGRIEITIDSPTGAVTAYASVLDNKTTDPLAVMPAFPSEINDTRYILPGMAGYNAANFHSDVRVYNGGTTDAIATLTFYPQDAAAVASAPVRIVPGQIKSYDDIVPKLFGQQDKGGSIVVTTSAPTSLVVTGRTYSNAPDGGTFGQFIPGVTPREGLAAGGAPLQVLQLEQSKNFRTNLGLVELTGNPARVRLTLIAPESKVSPVLEVDLAPNQFVQLNGVVDKMLNAPKSNTFNVRITAQVISGSGRVAAYGSVIDNATNDPTYVPAQ